MNSWKQTQSSLGLGDDEISTKVKKLISKHEKKVGDLKIVKEALASKTLSPEDKEEAETAKKILEKEVFDGNEDLKAHVTRLHRDRDINKARKERLLKSPGPGRGHKKDKSGTESPVVPITKNTVPAAATQQSTPAATGTQQTPAGTAASTTAATTATKPAAGATTTTATTAPPKPGTAAKQTTNPPDPSVKKKRSIAGAIFGFLIAGCLGAYVGKNI